MIEKEEDDDDDDDDHHHHQFDQYDHKDDQYVQYVQCCFVVLLFCCFLGGTGLGTTRWNIPLY